MASVSEHQPTTWASYIFDLHVLVFAAPAGLYFCFKKLTDGTIFLTVFALTAIYFSGACDWRSACPPNTAVPPYAVGRHERRRTNLVHALGGPTCQQP